MTLSVVMAGLVPAIHVFDRTGRKDVDARDKRGHDESNIAQLGITPLRAVLNLVWSKQRVFAVWQPLQFPPLAQLFERERQLTSVAASGLAHEIDEESWPARERVAQAGCAGARDRGRARPPLSDVGWPPRWRGEVDTHLGGPSAGVGSGILVKSRQAGRHDEVAVGAEAGRRRPMDLLLIEDVHVVIGDDDVL